MTTELVARSTLISYESATVFVSSNNTVLPADIFNPFKDFKLNAVSLYTSIVKSELDSPYSDFTWKVAVINPVWLSKYQIPSRLLPIKLVGETIVELEFGIMLNKTVNLSTANNTSSNVNLLLESNSSIP